MQLLRKGKVKEVYDAGPHELEFLFTDQISVFDKIIPTLIPKKGETLNRTSTHWFEFVEKKVGVPTHFLRSTGPNGMRVRKVDVIADYDKLSTTTKNHLIPLEVICRHYVAGSLHDRLKRGEIKPQTLGFDRLPAYGEPLPEPFVEFTTKLEKVDRELSEAEAQKISHLTDAEFDHLKEIVLDIDAVIADEVERRGLIHVDGKKEFAFNERREIMLVDTFGTADEDRWWDKERFSHGETVELSKEFVRQYYRKTGYFDQLQTARREKRPEPPIPALPPEVVKEVTDLYVNLYERITGKKF
ncbi:MAG: phosphoribosylaminoimidazolesuccinocarboxamide synthase [Thermoplasmatota archaeon]